MKLDARNKAKKKRHQTTSRTFRKYLYGEMFDIFKAGLIINGFKIGVTELEEM